MLEKNYFKVSNEFVEGMPELSSVAVRIYILFRRMINESQNGDEVWPSYTYIAKNSGVSRASIPKAINELIAHGWIAEIDKGFNSVNHYHVNDTPSRPNFELLQSRAKNALVQELNYSSSENELPVGQNLNSGSPKISLPVGQKVYSNNTNLTRLINQTKYNNIKEQIESNIKESNKDKYLKQEDVLGSIEKNSFVFDPYQYTLSIYQIDKIENVYLKRFIDELIKIGRATKEIIDQFHNNEPSAHAINQYSIDWFMSERL